LVALEKRTATAERRAAQLRDQLKDAEADASRLDGERRQVEEELAAAERELEQLRDEE
jgi:septal ring factor EnvC (AmiA/AmiB activator)